MQVKIVSDPLSS